ncbi:unnamed protein product [Lactuca saligna]|uniref:MULE transposase domain-containing protein n=1 Tax=Lactuca saligna TaxID=75948 RepID=A0AA35ZX27_LACSI|nr:unnamed protein product [Lactuca saligna]
MTQSEPNGLFAMVELNYQGVFNQNPFSYTGGVKTIFNDVDFSSLTYSEFVTFCERFMHEECKKFYYCEPDMSLMEGLNPILDDVEYSAFIFDAYGTDGVISVYVDHIGVGVDGWHDDEDNDDDEHESCIDGENEDNIDELRNVTFEFNVDVVHMNRTSNDPFLWRIALCYWGGGDANDKLYPIAWEVVNVENKHNWKWFLELLIDDLHLNLGNGFSLMSDQHKGLIEAVKELLPYVEHRQCARHICQNLQKRFTGAIYHTLFWRASKAITEHAFKVLMKEIETLNPYAHHYLMEKDPKTWSRAFFQTGRCCDAVENGFSESFNAIIVDARKKPIITMLEEIRLYMMDIIYNMKLKGQQWRNHICPEIRDKVNLLKKDQRHYQQLNGYGCAHSVASISFLNKDVEAYVDKMFSITTFRKAYNYKISPMNSSDMWPETNYTPPLPPINRRMPGRPTTKRKKSTTENTGTHRVFKAGKKIRCSICKEIGHNKATCLQRRPQKLNVKKQKKQKVCVKQNVGQGSTSEPQQHEEVEMTPIEMDTTQNDMQVAPTNVESSSAGDFSHYMQFTPPRCYEGDEGVMGDEADVVEEAVVVEQDVQDEEAEEVDPVIQVDNVHVQEVDEVNPNAQVDNGNVQEVSPVSQVQQVSVRPISEILKRIRRRKLERILKLKLGKTIGGVDDLGNSKGKALVID